MFIQATTPPELNVVQSPQLFPSVRPVFASRWSSQAPETFLQNPNGKLQTYNRTSNKIQQHQFYDCKINIIV